MKKSIILILLSVNLLLANSLSGMIPSGGGSFPSVNQNINSDIKNGKKTYRELINALKTTPNGEFALYLATIYLKGMDTPDAEGKTIKKDIDKSLFYFHKSIEYGYYNAAQILGSLYLYNEDLKLKENNIKKAEKYLKLALKNDLYDSTTVLADIYINQYNDIKSGVDFLTIGAEHNISTAQLMLAIIYNWGVLDKDKKTKIIKEDKAAAQMLLTQACTNKKQTKSVKEFCSSQYTKKQKQ